MSTDHSAGFNKIPAACVIWLAALGCTGKITSSGKSMGPGSGSGGAGTGMATGTGLTTGAGTGVAGATGTAAGFGGATGTAACNAATPDPGDAPLRRLTQEQYRNTIKDLFGAVNLDSVFPSSGSASQFGLAQADVDAVDLDKYQRAGEIVAAAVVADKTIMGRIAPCATGASGADARGCARTFLTAFGAKIYRATFPAADVDRHLALYDAGAVNGGYTHGMELVLRGMLQAPRFLYRVELGTGEAVGTTAVKLSGYELASRLSYSLWNTVPDDALYMAAAGGTLATPADVSTQLQRMIKDPRGATMVRHFLEAWVHLEDLKNVPKDGKLFPEWNDPLKTAMTTQAQRLFDDVLQTRGGTVQALLTSPTVFVNNTLAPFYSGSAPPADGTFQVQQRTDGTAAGMLTLPAFLATQAKAGESSPIYRGLFVREQLLCQQLPAPPANIPQAPDVKPGVSTRERFAQHEVDVSCAACHVLMDPIGFGFENFDAIGRYRTMDGGKAVDASGTISKTSDINGPFNGVAELGAKLAGSVDVQACVATQWFRYAMGRGEQAADTCSMEAVRQAFKVAGGDLRTLPAAIVQTPAFLYRRPL